MEDDIGPRLEPGSLQITRPLFVPAEIGQACYTCYRTGIKLQRCSGCHRVAYCGASCQKRHWGEHKAFCRALRQIENDPTAKSMLSFSVAGVPQDADIVNMSIDERVTNETELIQFQLGRPLELAEHALLAWEPRCVACGRSERLLRMQNIQNPSLIPCKDCNITFCCSELHWEAARVDHAVTPCEDVYGGLTQCQVNQRVNYDRLLELDIYRGGPMVLESYPWCPSTMKTTWNPLRRSTWDIFSDDFLRERRTERVFRQAEIDARFRAVTEYLSVPMTILYALELMNETSDWTRKDTLVIHVLGAFHNDIFYRQSMELILHRLPAVSNLKIMYCGNDLPRVAPRLDFAHSEREDLCPTCEELGKQMTYEYYADKYHSYIHSQGDRFTAPDLAVAFNSALFESHIPSWTTTIREAVRRKIPTLFTAYRAGEAKTEVQIIADAGATLLPDLGPCLNPFGSMVYRPQATQINGFGAANAWLSGAFHG